VRSLRGQGEKDNKPKKRNQKRDLKNANKKKKTKKRRTQGTRNSREEDRQCLKNRGGMGKTGCGPQALQRFLDGTRGKGRRNKTNETPRKNLKGMGRQIRKIAAQGMPQWGEKPEKISLGEATLKDPARGRDKCIIKLPNNNQTMLRGRKRKEKEGKKKREQ